MMGTLDQGVQLSQRYLARDAVPSAAAPQGRICGEHGGCTAPTSQPGHELAPVWRAGTWKWRVSLRAKAPETPILSQKELAWVKLETDSCAWCDGLNDVMGKARRKLAGTALLTCCVYQVPFVRLSPWHTSAVAAAAPSQHWRTSAWHGEQEPCPQSLQVAGVRRQGLTGPGASWPAPRVTAVPTAQRALLPSPRGRGADAAG